MSQNNTVSTCNYSAPESTPHDTATADKGCVRVEHISFPSADNHATCKGLVWLPALSEPEDSAPRGIIQLVHGMVEHISCYDAVARAAVRAGFIVCGIDHLGHGATQPDPKLRGVFDPHFGAVQLVDDQHTLRTIMQKRYPELPYCLVGHSMGSFVARCYLSTYGRGLAAAVIMGSTWQPFLRPMRLLLALIARVHGWEYRSRFVDSLGAGGYNKAFAGTGANTGYEWLSSSPERPRAYAADPDCGWMFSVSGYYVIANLLMEAQSAEALAEIPRSLPIYIISGDQDPVGNNGRGPAKLAHELKSAGLTSLTFSLIEGARHELFNEAPDKNQTEQIISWLQDCCTLAQRHKSKYLSAHADKIDSLYDFCLTNGRLKTPPHRPFDPSPEDMRERPRFVAVASTVRVVH